MRTEACRNPMNRGSERGEVNDPPPYINDMSTVDLDVMPKQMYLYGVAQRHATNLEGLSMG